MRTSLIYSPHSTPVRLFLHRFKPAVQFSTTVMGCEEIFGRCMVHPHGKLDPRSGDVTEYPMPDPRARDPHSLVFDREGMIFFTTQDSNFVGRLDPKTGKIALREVATPHALPYGIIIGPDSAAYFCEFGSNKIGKIDPKTLNVIEIILPDQGARPRRITNNPDGLIYYSDFARGFIGRLDPKTGKVEEWASPGGPNSHPYGIASTSDGTVWYSESGVKP